MTIASPRRARYTDDVLELGLVFALLGGLVGAGFLLTKLAWDLMLIGGLGLLVLGLVVGIPTGVVYHVLLHRACGARLPARWWIHPTEHHDLIPAERRRAVLAWCYTGAAGCGVALLGCGLIALGGYLGR